MAPKLTNKTSFTTDDCSSPNSQAAQLPLLGCQQLLIPDIHGCTSSLEQVGVVTLWACFYQPGHAPIWLDWAVCLMVLMRNVRLCKTVKMDVSN